MRERGAVDALLRLRYGLPRPLSRMRERGPVDALLRLRYGLPRPLSRTRERGASGVTGRQGVAPDRLRQQKPETTGATICCLFSVPMTRAVFSPLPHAGEGQGERVEDSRWRHTGQVSFRAPGCSSVTQPTGDILIWPDQGTFLIGSDSHGPLIWLTGIRRVPVSAQPYVDLQPGRIACDSSRRRRRCPPPDRQRQARHPLPDDRRRVRQGRCRAWAAG